MKSAIYFPVFLLFALLLAFETGVARSAESERMAAVLVFSKTAGYRHASIPAGIGALRGLGDQNGFRVDATEDAAAFSDENLAQYRAVVFLSPTGEVLDAGQQAAFERFIRHGGGFVGIHAATDTGYEWPWYGALVGAYFQRHPVIQPAVLKVVDPSHPSTRHLPLIWKRTDEWYDFRQDLAADITVLVKLDETSYRGGRLGANHPIAWYHTYDGGRAWYTAVGHSAEAFSEPLLLEHLRGGILWAAGMVGE